LPDYALHATLISTIICTIRSSIVALALLLCIASYLIGSLPFGFWVCRLWKGTDIREQGSGNIGATNVLRVLGPVPAGIVFVLDAGKGAVGIYLAKYVVWPWFSPADTPGMLVLALIGLSAILGHSFSVFLKFRGGKAVSTSLGMLLALAWPVAVVGLLAWLVVLATTRWVSLGSIIAALTLPFTAYFTREYYATSEVESWITVGIGVVLAVLVIVKHRSNISRLLAGTEPRIGAHTDTSAPSAGKREERPS
jgi:acyl phosphate:glycerol-3-phosphate acyltransferase